MTVVTMLSAVSQPGGDERAEELSQPRQTPLLLLISRLCFALLNTDRSPLLSWARDLDKLI